MNSINPLSYLNNFDNNVFQFHDIDESIVEKIIDNFPSKNSCGYDGISLRLLKFCKLKCTKSSDDLHNNRPHLRPMGPLRFTYVPLAKYPSVGRVAMRPGQCYGFTLSLIFKYCGGIGLY